MGTPKKHETQKKLVSPTIAEKVRSLEFGKWIGQGLRINRYSDVLEHIGEILSPLVPWLDRPIFPAAEFSSVSIPRKFQGARGMLLFRSDIMGMSVLLERSGKWFLRFYSSHRSGEAFRRADSRQLASILIERADNFLREFSAAAGNTLKGLPIKDIALYNLVFLRFSSEVLESVRALIKAREERLTAMKERLNLLGEFSQSLDPLVIRREEISLPRYFIWKNHKSDNKSSRHTAGYFCRNALGPAREALKKWRDPNYTYKEHASDCRIRSLPYFLSEIEMAIEGIKEYEGKARTDALLSELSEMDMAMEGINKREEKPNAGALLGTISTRPPFTEEELTVFKNLVGLIMGTI